MFFSLGCDQTTQVVLYLCNLILRLIRAQPKRGCCTSSGTTVSSPTGTPLKGQKAIILPAWELTLDNRIPKKKLFCHNFFPFRQLPPPHPQRWLGLGVHFACRSHSSGSSILYFSPQGILSKQHQFLVEVLTQNCKGASSFSQLNKLLPPPPLGPALPSKHLILVIDRQGKWTRVCSHAKLFLLSEGPEQARDVALTVYPTSRAWLS